MAVLYEALKSHSPLSILTLTPATCSTCASSEKISCLSVENDTIDLWPIGLALSRIVLSLLPLHNAAYGLGSSELGLCGKYRAIINSYTTQRMDWGCPSWACVETQSYHQLIHNTAYGLGLSELGLRGKYRAIINSYTTQRMDWGCPSWACVETQSYHQLIHNTAYGLGSSELGLRGKYRAIINSYTTQRMDWGCPSWACVETQSYHQLIHNAAYGLGSSELGLRGNTELSSTHTQLHKHLNILAVIIKH